MAGFFPTTASKLVLPVLPQCGRCGLYKKCRSPKMKVAGKGREGVLVVGEAPGKDEDRVGEPFVGSSGWRFREAVSKAGFDTFRDCWLSNALICHSSTKAKTQAVDWCRPNAVKLIEELKPKVILLLGGRAVKSVVGWLWKEDTGGVMRWAGFRCPSQQLNAWICPTYNPAYIQRLDHPVAEKVFDDHVRRALRFKERPWKTVPDWRKEVDCEQDPDLASRKIDARFGLKPVAFDFETNMLKPFHPKARIYCCSISDGKYTIAFPWHGRAVESAKKILESNVSKVGYNMKFEDAWCRANGITVNNWRHDGMLVAHAVDNRHQITGLKFQAFARFGMSDYESHIKPYLQSDDGGGYGVNRIKDLPLSQVLLYCGLDSLLEFKVWKHQLKELDR